MIGSFNYSAFKKIEFSKANSQTKYFLSKIQCLQTASQASDLIEIITSLKNYVSQNQLSHLWFFLMQKIKDWKKDIFQIPSCINPSWRILRILNKINFIKLKQLNLQNVNLQSIYGIGFLNSYTLQKLSLKNSLITKLQPFSKTNFKELRLIDLDYNFFEHDQLIKLSRVRVNSDQFRKLLLKSKYDPSLDAKLIEKQNHQKQQTRKGQYFKTMSDFRQIMKFPTSNPLNCHRGFQPITLTDISLNIRLKKKLLQKFKTTKDDFKKYGIIQNSIMRIIGIKNNNQANDDEDDLEDSDDLNAQENGLQQQYSRSQEQESSSNSSQAGVIFQSNDRKSIFQSKQQQSKQESQSQTNKDMITGNQTNNQR